MRHRILFTEENTNGGGAKSNTALAETAATYATVALLTANKTRPTNQAFDTYYSDASNAIRLGYASTLLRTIKDFRPTIIHATGMATGMLAVFLKRMLALKYKTIITLRHTSTTFRYHQISRHIFRQASSADAIHFLTKYQHDLYTGPLRLKPRRHYIIPNIVSRPQTNQQHTQQLRRNLLLQTASSQLIVYAGRIAASKRLDLFVDTIASLRNRGLRVGGVICGDGDKSHTFTLTERAERSGISSALVFTGHVDDVHNFILASDFGLFPTETEALPRFAIESFSLGRTLVTSSVPCMAETAKHEKNCLTAKSGDLAAYADACERLMKDKLLLTQLNENATGEYNTHYSDAVVTCRYRDLHDLADTTQPTNHFIFYNR